MTMNSHSRSQLLNIEIIQYAFMVMLIAASQYSVAGDIVTLNNSKVFAGKVTKIKNCMVTFMVDGDRYHIPAGDIHSIKFENQHDKVYRRYLNELEPDPYKCVNGRLDADNYHGKKSGHIALGFLFGPLAFLGTAMANPTPEKGQLTSQRSPNTELFNDPEYLDCYRKKAKGKLIGAESIGFSISLLMLLLITPTYLANK